MTAADFKATSFAYEVQRGFANKFLANKSVAKGLIDDTSGQLLDELYKLVKLYTKSKKEAEKVIKSLIKTSVKVGMLERADKFSAAERRAIEDVRRNIVTVAMTLVSFHQVDHTYDRAFVTKYLRDIQSDLKAVVRPHLTEKSLGRIDHMMDFFSQPQFLDSLHAADKTTDLSRQVAVLMALLNTCLEKGVI